MSDRGFLNLPILATKVLGGRHSSLMVPVRELTRVAGPRLAHPSGQALMGMDSRFDVLMESHDNPLR